MSVAVVKYFCWISVFWQIVETLKSLCRTILETSFNDTLGWKIFLVVQNSKNSSQISKYVFIAIGRAQAYSLKIQILLRYKLNCSKDFMIIEILRGRWLVKNRVPATRPAVICGPFFIFRPKMKIFSYHYIFVFPFFSEISPKNENVVMGKNLHFWSKNKKGTSYDI